MLFWRLLHNMVKTVFAKNRCISSLYKMAQTPTMCDLQLKLNELSKRSYQNLRHL